MFMFLLGVISGVMVSAVVIVISECATRRPRTREYGLHPILPENQLDCDPYEVMRRDYNNKDWSS